MPSIIYLVPAALIGMWVGQPAAGPAVDAGKQLESYRWYDGDRERVFSLSEDEIGVFLDSVDSSIVREPDIPALFGPLAPDASIEEFEGRIARLRMNSGMVRTALDSMRGKQANGSDIRWVDAVFYPSASREGNPFLLTGEMIVHFATPRDREQAATWARKHEVETLRSLQLDNAYLFSCPAGVACLQKTVAARADDAVRFAYPNWVRPKVRRNDPLFPDQWHLQNTGQGGGSAGEDANVVPAWNAGYTGDGVNIAIVDDGLEIGHEDLAENVLPGLSYDYVDGDTDPTAGDHGTSCAGVAAAAGFNSLGVRGAAYESRLVGYRLLGNDTDVNAADALTRNSQIISISSNSWGPWDDASWPVGPGPLTEAALASGATSGRGGKGLLYSWAGGNGQGANDNANYDGYANSRYTIAVAATTDAGVQSYYSEPGSNILVNAPSSGASLGITTTDGESSYTSTFGGTSSAAPLVAGVLGQLLQANPDLSWRDVKLLLAHTAEKNDPDDADWTINGAGLPVNHKYGYGRVDADSATQAAAGWAVVETEVNASANESPGTSIPDGTAPGVCGAWVSRTLEISDNIDIEFVQVEFQSDHSFWGNLEIRLESAMGTDNVLAELHLNGSGAGYGSGWRFGVERLIGENAAGTWTLKVRDCYEGDTGNIGNWGLTFFGTRSNVTCLAPPDDTTIAPDIPYTEPATVRSETTLETRGPVAVLSGGDVIFEATTSIDLNPGFRVAGGIFQARITPVDCGL